MPLAVAILYPSTVVGPLAASTTMLHSNRWALNLLIDISKAAGMKISLY